MTTANDPLKNIQSRIDELEQTISDRGEQIKARTRQLKDDLQEELSPVELIKKHPVESAGVSFVTGLVAGRIIRSVISPKRQRITVAATPQPAAKPGWAEKPKPHAKAAATEEPREASASPRGMAVGALGIEVIHALRDLAVTWIKNRSEENKGKTC